MALKEIVKIYLGHKRLFKSHYKGDTFQYMIENANLLPQTLASGKYVIISEVLMFCFFTQFKFMFGTLQASQSRGTLKSWSQQPCKHLRDIYTELSETNTSTQSYTTNVIGTETAKCTKSQQKPHPASKRSATGRCAH